MAHFVSHFPSEDVWCCDESSLSGVSDIGIFWMDGFNWSMAPLTHWQKKRGFNAWPIVTCLRCLILTHWGRDKMVVVFQTTLSNVFSWMKNGRHFSSENLWISIKILLKFVPNSPINISSDYGLALTWQQAIIWAKWLVYWCIYASLCLNELRIASMAQAHCQQEDVTAGKYFPCF